ncbi:hypothetical protein DSO57_1006080 [Entomophthora muscae]|uniref:Uncharacterized protein n=1 Tax=Entomophthora muscae TaxID=34485 RepID=A0ACC2SWL5_9FUNG|nr:hypothetical protein DSO57_1006080 [Entomophthora muscae]
MREANRISCEAHVLLMKKAIVGMNERELYAEFAYHCQKNGSSGLGYIPIVGSGKNGAILHYQKNSSDITRKGELVLVDAGCDFRYYAADITRTFPVGGKFTPEGQSIYSLVLKMQNAVFAELKEGVEWEDMHRLAMRVASHGLVELGILQGSPEDALKAGAVAVFFPHGLGHSIGLDVHDVGGYPEGVDRIQEPGICYLRMRRKLVAGMVVTVEPGIYFSPPIIELARNDAAVNPFINFSTVDSLIHVGGVRIEDSVVITANGYENLTPLIKEISEVEVAYQS